MRLLDYFDRIANHLRNYREVDLIIDNGNAKVKDEKASIHADALEERKQESFSLEKIKVVGEEAKTSLLQTIEALFGHIIQGLAYALSEEDGRRQVFLFTIAATLLVFSVSIGKEAIELLFAVLMRSLSMPRLVREWGRNSSQCGEEPKSMLSNIVLQEVDMKHVEDLCYITRIGRKRKAPLRNILLHGSTGTGKSLTARAIAEASNLPYAIMSGADIAPLGRLGPSELQRVLTWASSRKHGGVLIVDEAESALGKRLRRTDTSAANQDKDIAAHDASSTARDALNVFLSMTGDTGGNMMLILTTSNPSALDEAVLDRCDDVVCCSMPSRKERWGIIDTELKIRFQRRRTEERHYPLLRWFFRSRKILQYDGDFDIKIATHKLSEDKMTDGFSGRELSKIIRAVETAVYGSEGCTLTSELWDQVIVEMCDSIKAKKALKQWR